MRIELEKPTSSPAFGAIARSDRLVNLDFTRGMALLGILLVNSIVFFGPLAALMDPSTLAGKPLADRLASLAVLVLCQGKFISIFSLLFGYGLLGQFDRARESGYGAVRFAFRRLLPLSLFGLLHGLLIWFGDILFFYSLMGYCLLLGRWLSARAMILIGVALILFSLLVTGLLFFVTLGVPPESNPSDRDTTLRGWRAVVASSEGPTDPVWIAAEIAAYRDGPWRDAQLFRILGWMGNVVMMMLVGWMSLGMMFIGGALWRVKFFSPEQRNLRLRVLAIFLPVGLVIEAVAAWVLWPYPPTSQAYALGMFVQQIGVLFLPFGYLAMFALLADRLPSMLRDPIASAGRMSLTVYLMQSLVATFLAYHWGLQWFGRVDAAAQVILSFAIWAGLVILAHLWLMCFRQGPMEWLWRRLEYGRRTA